MKKTGLLHDQRFLLHDTGPYHPEVPERVTAIHKGLKDGGLLPRLSVFPAVTVDLKWIETIHDHRYVRRFEEVCLSGHKIFDYPDNQMCRETYETALLAAGGVLDMIDRIMKGELDTAFCVVRPPGHHAEINKAMGFCYFNNVAVAARYLQKQWNLSNIAVIDFDVHHGNGTQHIFEEDPTVLYYSIHQHPSFAFPGTGREFEKGRGDGKGFTINSPMLPGQGDREYQTSLERDLLPAMDAFHPEFIILSTGFDAHVDDDMADMNVSTNGFSWIMEQIVTAADRLADGRLISVLEGGYALDRLPELSKNHVEILQQGKTP